MRSKASLLALLISAIAFTAVLMQVWERVIPRNVRVPQSVLVGSAVPSYAQPTVLVIEKAEISLAIFSAQKKGNDWELTSKGVSYLSETPKPGEPGNSVLYGHNWPNLLGKLSKVKVGDTLTVFFGPGASRSFVVEQVSVVSPDKVDLLAQTTETRLTVYTCAGFLDSKRLVVMASPSRGPAALQ